VAAGLQERWESVSRGYATRRAELRARWRRLPERTRLIVVAAVQAAVAIAFAAGGYGSFALVLLVIYAFYWTSRLAPERWGRWAIAAAALVIAILYPNFVGDLGKLPVFNTFPSLDTAVTMLVFTMMAIGLNMVVGYAGLLDLGYVAFYAMGAYTAGWFASPQFAKHTFHFGDSGVNPNIPGFHVSIWLVLVLAAIFTAIVGVIIGLPTLRLRGDYLAIVTLGFGEIMPQIARNGDNLFNTGFNLTNGAQGINPIDAPGFASWSFISYTGDYVKLYYWTGLFLLLVTVFCSARLRDSRLGRAWVAIREDETAAAAMGIPLMRTKTWAYAAGAFFGGIAGAYYATYKQGVFPDDFSFNISVFILCMVILGGMGSIWGCIAGGLFLAYLNQDGLGNFSGWMQTTFGWNVDATKYSFGIYGGIILIVMLLRPQGLIGSRRRKAELEVGVHDEPLYDVSR
jgi:branched-chain amino acid transport system permease protein